MTTRTRLRLDLEWRITLLTLLLLPLMVGLGFWQLQRAEEKAGLAQRFEQRQAQAPVALQRVMSQPAGALSYLPVSLRGEFDPQRVFLLDNRTRGGRFGYEVLGLFRLSADAPAVLVNRGWIAGDASRQELPQVPPVAGEVSLRGHVYVAPGKPYMLAEQVLEPGWPKRIQALEQPLLERALGESLFPYPVRLDDAAPGALLTDWQVVNVSPEKHTGYAVQWFTMAAVLALIFVLRSSNLWQVLRGTRQSSEQDGTDDTSH